MMTWAALAVAAVAQPPGAPDAPYNGPPAAGPPMASPSAGTPRGPRPPDVLSRGPSIDLAVEAARAAVAACAGDHVGLAVLDAAGLPKLYYVADGAAGGHAYTGFRKANTALLIKAPSEQVAARAAADPALAAKLAASSNYVSWAGGLPIVVRGEVIGAIGVSGAEPSEKDEACAAAGLKAVQDRLR